MPKKLPKDFYLRTDTIAVAKDLLGKTLVVPDSKGGRTSGRIVEVEAYLGVSDKAAHSYGGRRTERTEVMYRAGGIAYVYYVYGMYHQFNVIAGPEEHPQGVLVRAVEPLENIESMRARRGEMPDSNLTSGPGKLCIAMGIDRSLNGEDLTGGKVWIEEGRMNSSEFLESGRRIGIDYAEEYAAKPWRFWIAGNPFVSKAPRRTAK